MIYMATGARPANNKHGESKNTTVSNYLFVSDNGDNCTQIAAAVCDKQIVTEVLTAILYT